MAFFRAFEGMEEGFRERAKKVVELLGEPTTRFVLITSPRRDAVEEARFFAEKIGDHDLAVDALIVNRVHPRFGTEHASGLRARAESLRELRVGEQGSRRGPDPARRPLRQPRRLQRDRRAGAQPPRDRAGAGRLGGRGVRARTSPTTSTTSTRSPRSAGSCSPKPPTRTATPTSEPWPGPVDELAFAAVETILVAAEAAWIRDQVQSAFVEPGPAGRRGHAGPGRARRGRRSTSPSVVILDMQIGNMGGIAVALDLRLEAGEGRLPDTPILLLLDREADHFLAKRADVDAALVKPVDAGRLRRAVKNLPTAPRPAVAAEPIRRKSPIPGGRDYTRSAYGMWRSLVSAQRSGR